jgi:ATP-dependent DNA helicase DinG
MSDLLRTVDRGLQACRSLEQAWSELVALSQRFQDMHDTLSLFLQTRRADQLRWLECGAELNLHQAPLTIAAQMRALLPSSDAQSTERGTSWVYTSATLGTDAQLSWFVNSCGLVGHTVLQVPSPFDYARQAALYVPSEGQATVAIDHSAEVAALVAKGVRSLGGRTMVLTTTLRAMRAIAQALSTDLADTGIAVLVQGQYSKRLMIEKFLRSPSATTDGIHQEEVGSVLVATASFWEGVDIAGDALQMLVIDKLPFAPPDDPLVQARALAIEQSGGTPFKELHLPHAALALKQGAGRLIRSESDRGVLVVCDPRLVQKGYGKKLLAGLPPMRRLADEAQWLHALEALRQER